MPSARVDGQERWTLQQGGGARFLCILCSDSPVFLDSWSNPAKQAPLDHLRARTRRVDISLPTIHWFLYDADTDATRELLTPKFDYRWKLIKEGHF